MWQKSLCMCVERELWPESPIWKGSGAWLGRRNNTPESNKLLLLQDNSDSTSRSSLHRPWALVCVVLLEQKSFREDWQEGKQSLSSPGSTGNAPPSAHSREGLPAPDPVEGPRTLPLDMADWAKMRTDPRAASPRAGWRLQWPVLGRGREAPGAVVKNPPADAGDVRGSGSVSGVEKSTWSRKW